MPYRVPMVPSAEVIVPEVKVSEMPSVTVESMPSVDVASMPKTEVEEQYQLVERKALSVDTGGQSYTITTSEPKDFDC